MVCPNPKGTNWPNYGPPEFQPFSGPTMGAKDLLAAWNFPDTSAITTRILSDSQDSEQVRDDFIRKLGSESRRLSTKRIDLNDLGMVLAAKWARVQVLTKIARNDPTALK
jgi:hypothetical protein